MKLVEHRVLTVRQPWAWAIIHGPKRVENRTWQTTHRGPLLIHASTRMERSLTNEDAIRRFEDQHQVKLPPAEELARGAILGIVDVIDCVPFDEATHASNSWAFGPWLWMLANPRAFAQPIPARGSLSLWKWTGEVG